MWIKAGRKRAAENECAPALIWIKAGASDPL
jgi:hypothetical protein